MSNGFSNSLVEVGKRSANLILGLYVFQFGQSSFDVCANSERWRKQGKTFLLKLFSDPSMLVASMASLGSPKTGKTAPLPLL